MFILKGRSLSPLLFTHTQLISMQSWIFYSGFYLQNKYVNVSCTETQCENKMRTPEKYYKKTFCSDPF